MSRLEIRLDGRTIAEIDVRGQEPRVVDAETRARVLSIIRATGPAGIARSDLWQRRAADAAALDALTAAGEVVAVKEARSRPGARATRYFAKDSAP